jgi:hypothetical protein
MSEMSEVNVVYRTSAPRFVAEMYVLDYYNPYNDTQYGDWDQLRGFESLENAKGYADEQQRDNPSMQFRVVDTQP